MKLTKLRGIVYGLSLLLNVGLTIPAAAQQPLSAFIEAAAKRALDVRTSEAERKEAAARREEARGALLPSLSATGRYGHNQYEIDFTPPGSTEPIIIQRRDQFTGDVTISMPIVDIAAWASFFQTRSLAESAKWGVSLARLNVFIDVVQQWHASVAARALVRAAERNLEVAKRTSDQSSVRVKVGASEPLEFSRAKAELARAEQALANAKLQRELTARRLFDLTFLEPSSSDAQLEQLASAPEPLEEFMQRASSAPRVRVAKANRRAAKSAANSAGFALLPVIDGFFTESATNSAGFTRSRQWVTGLIATWVFNYSLPAAVRAERAALEKAEIDAERAEQQVRTAIFEAWQRVVATRAEVDATIASEEASQRAARDAHVRFGAGSSTQLDQIQADRDLFSAEVSKIEALANLGVARAALFLQAGLPLPK